MTNNRVQHELAAKAADLAITWKTGSCKGGPFEVAFIGDQPWRPRDDDGDAFRLQVKLKLDVNVGEGNSCASWYPHRYYPNQSAPHLSDPLAATRLAIFRAAVEIGKAMP